MTVHLDQGGGITRPKSQSPRVIHAWSQARESFARTCIGGAILALLAIAYVVALFYRVEGARDILLLLGSGLGYFVGTGSGRERPPPES